MESGAIKVIKGDSKAQGRKFAIAAGRFNSAVSEKLVAGALEAIKANGGDESAVTVVWVPGSFELPLVCQELAASDNFDAVIALGTLIEGETDHYRLIADSLGRGFSSISLETGVPVAFGVITAKSLELALQRSGSGHENRGYEAALAAILTASVLSELRGYLD